MYHFYFLQIDTCNGLISKLIASNSIDSDYMINTILEICDNTQVLLDKLSCTLR
ncbi:hypothetical protein SAMN05216339_104153 [Nitrosomonas eutropha]|uniref:Uncharacterized protein n=1 Tax=Nitrosomonas eutropha TaxID=916 RepID=A0A1I7H8T0_9PROT|nr:hypothetical protein SAMN05216339_104153 [Nitrosomonas eutropha]